MLVDTELERTNRLMEGAKENRVPEEGAVERKVSPKASDTE